LRAQQASEQGMGALGEPVSHGTPSAEQLAGLQAHFAQGTYQRAALTGRPVAAEQLAAEVERAYWTREVRAGQRLHPVRLARELGAEPHQLAAQLGELRAGPTTARERIEQLWRAQRQDPATRPLSSSRLAWRVGVSDSYVRHVTWQLRTRAGIVPLQGRLAATREQLATPPPPLPTGAGREWDWRQDAACRDTDPELFFPEPGKLPQVARAKEICAGCAVRGPCLDNALHGPLSRDDHHGIYAGTTARDRAGLRGRPSMADGTRFLHDRAAAEQALALANQKSIDRAAKELGVSKQALRRAFDHHGLGQPAVFQGGPARSRFYHDPKAAAQAWRRAAEVGINQTRKELGVSDRALRTAWARHGLGLPPPRPPHRPRRPWTRHSSPSTTTSSPPTAAPRPTRPHGCAATRRSTPSATPRSSRSTARAGSPSSGAWPPSPAAPSAPSTSPTSAKVAATAAAPTAPTAAGVPTTANPRSSRCQPMAADLAHPDDRPDPASRFHADLTGYLRGLSGPELADLLAGLPDPVTIDLIAALAARGPAHARLPDT
jgi:WhiB family redox-sensing transcriptional regulator